MKIKKHILLLILLAAVFVVPELFADTISIPGGGSSSDITTKLTTKTNQAKLIFGVIIGALGVGSAAIGSINYTLKKWERGHGWMAAGAVGILVGSLITAYASFWAA